MGSRQALRMVAAHFGNAHFYGVPYGVIGVLLAWFLGWIALEGAIGSGHGAVRARRRGIVAGGIVAPLNCS